MSTLSYVVLDFETMSGVDLTEVGAYCYGAHPTTEIICGGYAIEGKPATLWWPGESIEALRALAYDDRFTFIAFNVAFERAIWREIMVPVYGLPELPLMRWHDIQAAAALKGLPQNLDDLGAILELKTQKDMEGSKAAKELSRFGKNGNYDISPAKLKQVGTYCLGDVDEEMEAHQVLGFLPPGERRSWLLTQEMNDRGVLLDMDYVRQSQKIVDLVTPKLVAEFVALTGVTPTQTKKFKQWLSDNGAELPDMRKETLVNLIGAAIDGEADDATYADQEGAAERSGLTPAVTRALRIRQLVGSSSISKLARMEACVNTDRRARGLFHWHGTGPGRNAGRLLQPQNFPKPTLKADDEIIDPAVVVQAIMTGDPGYVDSIIGPPIETVAGGLRHALIAEPGRVFMSGDYAGIQARLVLAMAGQSDKCAMMAAGQDVYVDMGSSIFGRPIDKKHDPWERGIGKNTVLGCGFQMGAKTFDIKYVAAFKKSRDRFENDDDRLKFCETVIRAYRKDWAPMVPPLWYALDDAAVAAVWDKKPTEAYGILYQVEGDWLTARLPSGRKIWYYNPEGFWNKKFNPQDPKRAVSYWALKNGRMVRTAMFGGKNTENVIMGMEADLMRDAIDKCRDNNLPVVLDVHDELVVEPLEKDADVKLLKQIMLDIPPWAQKLKAPINIDTWVGDRYRK